MAGAGKVAQVRVLPRHDIQYLRQLTVAGDLCRIKLHAILGVALGLASARRGCLRRGVWRSSPRASLGPHRGCAAQAPRPRSRRGARGARGRVDRGLKILRADAPCRPAGAAVGLCCAGGAAERCSAAKSAVASRRLASAMIVSRARRALRCRRRRVAGAGAGSRASSCPVRCLQLRDPDADRLLLLRQAPDSAQARSSARSGSPRYRSSTTARLRCAGSEICIRGDGTLIGGAPPRQTHHACAT